MCNTVTSACSSQCQYFTLASKEWYTWRLRTMVTCVDKQERCNFHGMVQCYGQMLHIAVMLCNNFLHLVILSQTTLVTRCCLRLFFVTVLHYMSIPTLKIFLIVENHFKHVEALKETFSPTFLQDLKKM